MTSNQHSSSHQSSYQHKNAWFSIAWRLFCHESKRGELTIILLAISLSVASVLALSLFSERLQYALTEKAANYFTADRMLWSANPAPTQWLEKAKQSELTMATQLRSNSMLFAGDAMSLVFVRAIDENFPLKGTIRIAPQPFAEGADTDLTPAQGEIWLESRIFQLLNVQLGSMVELGDIKLKVTQVLAQLPDQGFSLGNSSPHVVINITDIKAAGLIGQHSNAWFSYSFVGSDEAIIQYEDWLLPQLDNEVHGWDTAEDAKDFWLSRTIRKAGQYFLLSSLLAIILASISIAVAAQRYCQRHYDPVAIMKTLGGSNSQIRKIFLLQIGFISIAGIIIGTSIGYVFQYGISTLIANQLNIELSGWYWRPFIIAIFTGCCCAFLFSVYPLMKLFSVPPLRVLRRDIDAKPLKFTFNLLASGIAIFLLMWAYSNDLKISAILFASGVILVLVLLAITLVFITLGRRYAQAEFSPGLAGAWNLAWARIQRRAMGNSIQLISFSLTIMLLLIVIVLRNDMLEQWRSQLPEGTPNYFLANITKQELPELQRHLATFDVFPKEYYPVIRSRLTAINDETIDTTIDKVKKKNEKEEKEIKIEDKGKAKEESTDKEREGFGREVNLTWRDTLPFKNEIVEGTWWEKDVPNSVSVEEKVAGELNIIIGDKITFNIGSQIVTASVTNLRSVNWQTMQPNFYFILNPDAVTDISPTYITAFNLAKDQKSELNKMLKPFPTLSLFDVDYRIQQVKDVIKQVSAAVEFILILILCAGSLVLIAQVQASIEERQQELAILRTLGAKGKLIQQSVVLEFVIVGIISGIIAAFANEIALYMLQTNIFEMEYSFHFEFWLLAPLVGASVVGCLGALTCWRLLRINTLKLIREVM